MTTRRSFIRQSGLTAGGLATATALGASVFPAGEGNSRKQEGMKGLKISKMFAEPLSIEMDLRFAICDVRCAMWDVGLTFRLSDSQTLVPR